MTIQYLGVTFYESDSDSDSLITLNSLTSDEDEDKNERVRLTKIKADYDVLYNHDINLLQQKNYHEFLCYCKTRYNIVDSNSRGMCKKRIRVFNETLSLTENGNFNINRKLNLCLGQSFGIKFKLTTNYFELNNKESPNGFSQYINTGVFRPEIEFINSL
jgi:hypothetical protein